MFYLQNLKKKFFFKIFSKVGTVKKIFFQIFQNYQIFFEKWPQGVLKNMKRNKVMEYEHIWSVCRSMTRDYLPGGVR